VVVPIPTLPVYVMRILSVRVLSLTAFLVENAKSPTLFETLLVRSPLMAANLPKFPALPVPPKIKDPPLPDAPPVFVSLRTSDAPKFAEVLRAAVDCPEPAITILASGVVVPIPTLLPLVIVTALFELFMLKVNDDAR
jgi:hypothetical protein